MKGQVFTPGKSPAAAGNTSSNSSAAYQQGHRRSNSRHNTHHRESPTSGSLTGVGSAQLVDLVAKSCGKTVVATVSSGARYKGLLLSVDISPSGNGMSVSLVGPRLVTRALLDEKSNSDSDLPETLLIQAKDLIDVEIVLPRHGDDQAKNGGDQNKTASGEKKSKQTPPPVAEPAAPTPQSRFKTDSDISSGFHFRERELQKWVPDDNSKALSLEDDSAPWDQFKVNEEKFGVESSYDEHLYTTKIDTLAHDYAQRLERAEKLAREIEGNASGDRHVLEERGLAVDDSGLDEEDKYSGVHNAVDTRGQELMAALRIGNGLKPQLPPSHEQPIVTHAAKDAPAKQTKPEEKPAPEKPAQTGKPVHSEAGSSSETSKSSENGGFRSAQSEFNALREFSANFKVPHKLPNDLLPILAKDKEKQEEILKQQKAKEKKDLKPFKLNPKAASFTPNKATSPVPPKASFKSPGTASPRMNTLRPYGPGSSGSATTKRHHQISAADFFGGADKVPTAEGQKEKISRMRQSFLLFTHAKQQAQKTEESAGKETVKGPVLQKPFYTPPTWDSSVDETYEELLASQTLKSNRAPMMAPVPGMPYLGNPLMMPAGGPQLAAGGFPGPAVASKYPVSPQMQSPATMAAQFQQQQQLQAMLYQQFQGGGPPGQPHLMYAPPDSQFIPPGFMIPGFANPGSPVNAAAGFTPGHNNYNGHPHHNRRYNGQGKRGNHHS